MSEIRSQATPEREELAERLMELWGWLGPDAAKMLVEQVEAAGWSKPRTANSVTDLDALPEDTVIRVQKRKGAKFATYYEKIHRNMWLALDPGDRSDGEDSWDAQVIVRFNEAITVLFAPGDAG